MDYFQSDINSFEDDSLIHWENSEVEIWDEERFVNFLEKQCGLSKKERIKGKIFNFHVDTYFTIRDLIKHGEATPPCSITHIDAHSDMAFDTSIRYYRFLKTLAHENKKDFESRTLFDNKNLEYVNSGNYLVALSLNEWVHKITYVYHENTTELDFSENYIKYDVKMKKFRFNFFGDISLPWSEIEVVSGSDFVSQDKYDYVCVAVSPSYTVRDIIRLVDILKDYIDLED